jgi:hypothetical protein
MIVKKEEIVKDKKPIFEKVIIANIGVTHDILDKD